MTTIGKDGGALESWLKRATYLLSTASAAQARSEIREHYESACEEAVAGGADPKEAERRALESLGDARAANQEFRRVLLTASEAGLLREVKWEARSLESCSWLVVIPVGALSASVWFLATGHTYLGWMLLLGAAGPFLLLARRFLSIHTPGRARVFRAIRWAWLAAVIILPLWPDVVKMSWLLIACAWPVAWVEWTLSSLRRKLPPAQWPPPLYS